MTWVFIFILTILLFIEYQSYRTCITPFFVVGVIYLFSIPIVNIIGVKLGYYKINASTMLLFLAFLFEIFFLDLVYKLLSRKRLTLEKEQSISFAAKHQKYIWYVFLLFLFGYVLSFIQALNIYGMSNIKGRSNGIFGHMGLFCIAISPYIVILLFKTKKIKYILSLIILYLIMMLFGGKTYIFISIVSAGILLYGEKKVRPIDLIKLGVTLFIIALVVFIFIYAVIPCWNAKIKSWPIIRGYIVEAVQHFFYYFSAPFLCSNSYFNMPIAEGLIKGLRIMFAPFVSLYEVLLGNKDYPYIIMHEWVPIADAAHRTTSNVGGLFSESVYHIGRGGAFFYVALVSSYIHTVYYIKCNLQYFHASSALCIALIGLCFFCNYFTLLVVLELIVYLLIFELSLMLFDKRKIYIRDWRFTKKWKKIKL